ncbi:hypothetical protein [Amycolatopsis sp. NPDC057786]|uniref:hypothetical protein n=1 Tax=Amycolatopsis sp. NPDC057786 TaxID=3346250 RepID=UPI00366DDF2C
MSIMSTRATILAALALAISASLTTLTGVASANHAGQPTRQQLMNKCAGADYCEFKPQGGMQVFGGPNMLAGSSTNCTNFNQTRVIRWESTSGTTNTFGVEISAGVTLGEIFELSIKSSFQREWSWTDTKADEIRQDVGKKSRVDIYAQKQQTRVDGQWEIHFGSRYYGHYYWFVNGSVTGQTKGQPWHTTARQVKANC